MDNLFELSITDDLKQKLIREVILSMVAVAEMDNDNSKIAAKEYRRRLYLLDTNNIKTKCVYAFIKVFGVRFFASILSIVKKIRRKAIYH